MRTENVYRLSGNAEVKAPASLSLFEAAAKTGSYDSDPQRWDEVLRTLNLDLRYQLAVAEVLRQGRWRTARAPSAYIASAAVRSARRKELSDYFEKKFRRVPSDKSGNSAGTHEDSLFKSLEEMEFWAYVYSDDGEDDRYLNIPEWLKRPHEHDAVDWETVAVYAALKPRMASLLAQVLMMRLEFRTGRPAAIASGQDHDQAAAIEAAWKWIDRNFKDRISPLFRTDEPPLPLRAEDIASFIPVAPGVSLRVDVHTNWEGSRLVLMRTTLIPPGGETVPVFCVPAASAEAAWAKLGAAARKCKVLSNYLHFWEIESDSSPKLKKEERPHKCPFVKPWEALSRACSLR
jgi:hypothetical protein